MQLPFFISDATRLFNLPLAYAIQDLDDLYESLFPSSPLYVLSVKGGTVRQKEKSPYDSRTQDVDQVPSDSGEKKIVIVDYSLLTPLPH